MVIPWLALRFGQHSPFAKHILVCAPMSSPSSLSLMAVSIKHWPLVRGISSERIPTGKETYFPLAQKHGNPKTSHVQLNLLSVHEPAPFWVLCSLSQGQPTFLLHPASIAGLYLTPRICKHGELLSMHTTTLDKCWQPCRLVPLATPGISEHLKGIANSPMKVPLLGVPISRTLFRHHALLC